MSSVPRTSLLCIRSPSTPTKTASLLIVRRQVVLVLPFLAADIQNRLQADEAYQVGKGLTPVGAYLAQDDIIRIALEHGVDMIHPG